MDYIENLFAFAGIKPRKILDIACGTGVPTLILADRGYELVGVDLSEEMLAIAQMKLRGNEKVRFFKQDMRNLNLDETFDAAICLFDSLNNLLTEDDLLRAFQSAKRHIKAGGVYIFDLNTPYCLKYFWGNNVRVKEDGDLISVWRTRFHRKKKISELHISIFVPVGPGIFSRVDEFHRERGFEIEEVEELLKKAGFAKIHVFEHLTFNPPRKTTLRVTFLAL